ncbi:hypothetical protein [Sphingopyxis fribergensis]|nr:hypothetical protein [Sphingopyxis fribergensis]
MFATLDPANIAAIQSCLMSKPFLRHAKLASAGADAFAQDVEIRVHARTSCQRGVSVHGVRIPLLTFCSYLGLERNIEMKMLTGIAMASAAVAACWSGAAWAQTGSEKPTDLSCKFLPPSAPETFELRIDTSANTVSWESRGGPQAARAVFTANNIAFRNFSIDRETLKLTRKNDSLYVRAWGLPPIEHAECAVVEKKTKI